MIIRKYRLSDWDSIEQIHDISRQVELKLAGLEDAFLPLKVAAEREGLFDYPGIFVAEESGTVLGFAACTEEEVAWLYVDPNYMRQGIGRKLTEFALHEFPMIRHIEVLAGNEPAKALYESVGFEVTGSESGKMPGNEAFSVRVFILERKPS